MDKRIVDGGFKAKCELGQPVARLVPIEGSPAPLFGRMKGTMEIVGHIVGPVDEPWDADGP